MHTSRREFLKMTALATAQVTAGGCLSDRRAGTDDVAHWWKGMLHCHTHWSDGRAFPEQAVAWYKAHGYHFLAMSDHNCFADDGERWKSAASVDKSMLDAYRRDFAPEERPLRDGGREIRLRTYEECRRRFDEPGRFLLLPGVEATHAVRAPDGVFRQVHCNYIGVPGLLPQHALPDGGRVETSASAPELIDRLRRQSEAKARERGARCLFMVNHPIWQWYDISPEMLVELPDVRFFELCNNGAWLPESVSPRQGQPARELPQDGFDTDRFWDVVNAFRARRQQRLLYGIGSDDAHAYGDFDDGGTRDCVTGDAWIRVGARALSMEGIFAAMEEGRFVTCAGVEPETVEFDRRTGRLEVSVAARSGVSHVVRFIVSKRDFSETPIRTLEIMPEGAAGKGGRRPETARTVCVYDEKIGQTAHVVEGRPGERLRAAYTLQPDDLYVRARIESPMEVAHVLCPLHPKIKVAWTQPYGLRG